MTYTTPRACYRKAPVRRETPVERHWRHFDQVPDTNGLRTLRVLKGFGRVTINKDLVPGKAKFVKEVSHD